MPDWRNAAAYEFRFKIPNLQWAWEFLRRNPDYRDDWARALARLGDAADMSKRLFWSGEEDPVDASFCIPSEEQARWHLEHGLLNPATDLPHKLGFVIGWGKLETRGPDESRPPGPGGDRYPWMVFDAHLPLKPQALAVLGALRWHQEFVVRYRPPRIKHHRKLWPLYLRLLDAESEGLGAKDVAEVLSLETPLGVTDAKVWEQLSAARRLTLPEGYLSIFLSPAPRQTRVIRRSE
ncbi:MAG TPA: DUF6499 domain-containing protein [Thermoanaerobaculia bacterium]|nr:DUF6499 domain-containing protein [Thermoanaerobaculia bacterium]